MSEMWVLSGIAVMVAGFSGVAATASAVPIMESRVTRSAS